jgi:hypothetical protein
MSEKTIELAIPLLTPEVKNGYDDCLAIWKRRCSTTKAFCAPMWSTRKCRSNFASTTIRT